MDNKQTAAPQVQQKRSGGAVNPGWIVIIIALAFASGYMFARSVIFSPGAAWAQVHFSGLGISAVLVLVAFGLIGLVGKR